MEPRFGQVFFLSMFLLLFVIAKTRSQQAVQVYDLLVSDMTGRDKAILLDQMLHNNIDSFDCPAEKTTTSVSTENYAAGKTAWSSSHYVGRGPNAAIDGVTNCQWSANSVTRTNDEINPWWMVDMGRQVCVGRVKLFNRADCCGEYLRDFTITVSGEKDGDSKVCGTFAGSVATGGIETINCKVRVYGRFLKIQITGWSHLMLCEVQVYAKREAVISATPVS